MKQSTCRHCGLKITRQTRRTPWVDNAPYARHLSHVCMQAAWARHKPVRAKTVKDNDNDDLSRNYGLLSFSW